MKTFFLGIFQKIENLPLGWRHIFFIAGGVIALRIVLEAFLDQQTVFSYWTLIFWGSWFFSLFLFFINLVARIAKISTVKAARLLLVGLPVILLPPLELLLGITNSFEFLKGTWSDIGFHLVTFVALYPHLGPLFTVEILLFLGAVFTYIFFQTNALRALGGALVAYFLLAFYAIQPKIIEDTPLAFLFFNSGSDVPVFAAVNFFLLLLASLLLFRENSPDKAKALFQLRPDRSISFFAFGLLAFLSAGMTGAFATLNFLLGFGIFIFFLMYAALANDVSDIAIDRISNPKRPFVRGIFSLGEMFLLQRIVLAIIFVLVLILDSAVLFLVTLFNIGLSFLYSNLRWRRNFFSFLLVALGESTVVLYGYFSQAPEASAFSGDVLNAFLAVFVFLALFLPVKDLKDIAGDKHDGVANIVTVFGWNKGKMIIAASVFCAYVLFGWLALGSALLILAFFFGVVGAVFVIYYEKVGERASYIHLLLFFIICLFTRL